MITERTNNTQINWLIDRATFQDMTGGHYAFEGELRLIVGTFTGFLPYNMRRDLVDFTRNHTGDTYNSGTMNSYIMVDEFNELEKTHRRVSCKWSFGKYKSDANKINFTITDEVYRLTEEDITELKEKGIL